jgi:type IX secretion system PorP/SprF family membrane protein
MRHLLLILGLVSAMVFNGAAQDHKFSQFYNSPLNLNPALTGKINSYYRIVANYRNQYARISTPSPYNTFSFSGDAGFLRDQLNDNILGAGLLFVSDHQGGVLRTNQIFLSTAYHQGFGYDKKHFLSVGFQAGVVNRSIDRNIFFADEFNGESFDLGTSIDWLNIEDRAIWNFNMHAGIFWSSSFSESISAYAGGALFNILRPKETFLGEENERDFRYTGSGGLVIDINKKVMLSPNALFMRQSEATQIIAGTTASFNLSGPRRPYETSLYVGGMYDFNGAIIGSAGVQYQGFQLGMSYDLTLSNLNDANNGYGAFEVSIIYVGKPVERGQKYPLLNCPKFN